MDILSSPRRAISRGDFNSASGSLPEMSPCYSPRRVSRLGSLNSVYSGTSSCSLDDEDDCYSIVSHATTTSGSDTSGGAGNRQVSVYFSPSRSPRRFLVGNDKDKNDAADNASSCSNSPSKLSRGVSSVCSSARRRVAKGKAALGLGALCAPQLDDGGNNKSTVSTNNTVLTEKQAIALCQRIRQTVDDQMAREEELTAAVAAQRDLAKARYDNGSQREAALVALRRARRCQGRRSRVTWAVDVAMDALFEIETKMARGRARAVRKKGDGATYKVDLGEHAHVLQEVQSILDGSDSGDEDDEEDNLESERGKLPEQDDEEELLQQLRDME